jgi:histidine ammonia-lyase
MGANAATKMYRIVNNVYSILAIELLTASQALAFRRPLKTSPYLEELVNTFRKHVPFVEEDRVLHDDIRKAEKFIREYKL